MPELAERYVRTCAKHKREVRTTDDGRMLCKILSHEVTTYRVFDREKRTFSDVFSANKDGAIKMRRLPTSEAKTVPDDDQTPQSLVVLKAGIRTDRDFAELISAVMRDILEKRIDKGTANIMLASADRILRVAELQLRYHGALEKTGGEWFLLPSGEEQGEAR